MATEPTGWNIVIVGDWNTAILTPDGVRRRLYQLPDGTPVTIEVAIDRPGPYRIRHDGLIIAPSNKQLDISMDQCDLPSIGKAKTLACRALISLPETPVSAAGVNFRYQVSELSDELLDLTNLSLDNVFSDNGYRISSRKVTRSLLLDPGKINIELTQEKEVSGILIANFHLDSSDHQRLSEWINRTEEFFEVTQKLLSLMNIPHSN